MIMNCHHAKQHFTRIEMKEIIVYFSYDIMIAFIHRGITYISRNKNKWHKETNKHLDLIDSDKRKRIPHIDLMKLFAKI